jgi:O-antigen/teichoic acid export membrane protein
MTINTVALIVGALGFSAALSWNRAVSETIEKVVDTKSAILQALVTTLSIVIIVFLVNLYLEAYTKLMNINLSHYVIKHGSNKNSRVTLWNS